jgi:hypothetical protein
VETIYLDLKGNMLYLQVTGRDSSKKSRIEARLIV